MIVKSPPPDTLGNSELTRRKIRFTKPALLFVILLTLLSLSVISYILYELIDWSSL